MTKIPFNLEQAKAGRGFRHANNYWTVERFHCFEDEVWIKWKSVDYVKRYTLDELGLLEMLPQKRSVWTWLARHPSTKEFTAWSANSKGEALGAMNCSVYTHYPDTLHENIIEE